MVTPSSVRVVGTAEYLPADSNHTRIMFNSIRPFIAMPLPSSWRGTSKRVSALYLLARRRDHPRSPALPRDPLTQAGSAPEGRPGIDGPFPNECHTRYL